ncbi:c-type cytochrome [Roseomonas gilardii]|uniref:c-type cytochrome n=1 Tax=Roseomonas gilardii TaxID=257708 RepID=UPI000481C0B7|nr:cytochrome c family protein [Roseomonas gilardii]SUE42885.1 Cytochrome c2 [Roseomonas gilardii subsp. rosea]
MSLEGNKAFAAILTAGVVFGVAGFIGSVVVSPHRLEKPAIQIGDAPAEAGAAAPAPYEVPPIAPLLANANADTGRTLAQRQCGACHIFENNGRNGVGPNLYGIVGRPHAAVEGFNYSPANKAEAGHVWDYEAINRFISAPARAMPGTRMAFAGLSNPQQRADVLAYLRTLSDNPPPLPTP